MCLVLKVTVDVPFELIVALLSSNLTVQGQRKGIRMTMSYLN